MATRKPKTPPSNPSAQDFRPENVPVTQAMLFGARDELIHRMGLMEGRLEAKFESRFSKSDDKLVAIDRRFEEMDRKIDRVHDSLAVKISRVHTGMGLLRTELSAEISRLGVLVEEQNARNRVVLEGLSGLFRRQDKVEQEVAETKRFIQDMAAIMRKSGFPISS